jgi:hypothetical protein
MYVDGVDEGALSVIGGSNSGEWLDAVPLRDNFSIGTFCGATCPSSQFNGTVAHVKLWDYVLSSDEILAEANTPRTGSSQNLPTTAGGIVLAMPLDDEHSRSATVTNDLSPYAGTGTASGTPPTWGVAGAGVTLNGSNDYVVIADADHFSFGDGAGNDDSFTVCAWVNMVSAQNFSIITRRVAGGFANQDWAFYTSGDQKLYFALYDDDTTGLIYTGSTSVVTGQVGSWTHFCGVSSGNESETGLTLYQNGAALAQTQASSGVYTSMANKAVDTWIGRMLTAYANGQIALVTLWGYELSGNEILAEYNTPRTGSAQNLPTTAGGIVLAMPLDDEHSRSATVANDLSPYAAIGTASGTPAPTYGASGVTLDGIDQVVTIPNHANFTPGDGAGTDGPFSICATVNRTAAGSTEPFISKRTANTAVTMEWQFGFVNDFVGCYFFGNALTDFITARSATDSEISYAGTATRYCCTYDGSESETGILIYRNGIDITDTQSEIGTYTGLTARAIDVTVGFFAATIYFDGILGAADIWRKELSPAEVLADTNEHQ